LPAHSAIRITTGAGKSEKVREAIATTFIPKTKRRNLPHRVLFLVPTHRLGAEARTKMPDGVTAALWQGRGGRDVTTDEPLCKNIEAVNIAVKLGADVESSVCKRGRGNKAVKCPFYDECLYQQQKHAVKKADVIFAAHEIGFKIPKTLGKNFGLVIIDEQSWQRAGLSYGKQLAVEGLAHELKTFPVLDKAGNVDADATAHLADLIDRLQTALRAAPDGYLAKTPIINAGLLPSTTYEDGSCRNAAKHEWARKVDIDLRPDDDQETRRAVAEQHQFQGQIKRRATMWRALDDLISGEAEQTGRLKLWTKTDGDGSVRFLEILGRKDLDEKVLSLPILHLDATLDIGIVKHFLPRVELVLDVEVEAPHQTIVQVVNKSTAKWALKPCKPGERKPEEEQRIANFRQSLVDLVRHHVVGGKRGLVITYESVEPSFQTIDNVETGHFNAVAGIDRWGGRDVAFIIGRPDAPAQEVERIAAALTGKPVRIEKKVVRGRESDKVEVVRLIRLQDGTQRGLWCPVYEEADAELVRRWITEAELTQAVGRVRGVNRTVRNPVRVLVICHDNPFPGVINQVVNWDDIKPDEFDEMLVRGLLPASPTDAARLYPELFASEDAAKKAYIRAGLSEESFASVDAFTSRSGTNPYKTLYREMSLTSATMVRYQPAGAGKRPRAAIWHPGRAPAARAALEAALGPLAKFEVVPAKWPAWRVADPRLVADARAAVLAGIRPLLPPDDQGNVVWLAARGHAASAGRAEMRAAVRSVRAEVQAMFGRLVA
jgi:hypothetical protein